MQTIQLDIQDDKLTTFLNIIQTSKRKIRNAYKNTNFQTGTWELKK